MTWNAGCVLELAFGRKEILVRVCGKAREGWLVGLMDFKLACKEAICADHGEHDHTVDHLPGQDGRYLLVSCRTFRDALSQ